jgi:hypothetical protein
MVWRPNLTACVIAFVSDGQGLRPWNPLGEMISPSPPQRGMCNFRVKIL